MTTTTLADQIVALCEKIRSSSEYNDKTISIALAGLMGVPPESREFYAALVSIRCGIIKLIEEMEDDTNFSTIMEFNKPQISALPQYFNSENMHQGWSNVRSVFQQAYQPLKTFAAFQRAYNSGVGIDGDAINVLIDELRQLQKFTTDSDLPADLKEFALKQIAALISALSLSMYVPVDALWDMTFLTYGRLMRRKGEFERVEGTEGQDSEDKPKTVFSKISNIANRTLTVCDAVHKAGEVVDAVGAMAGKFLPVN